MIEISCQRATKDLIPELLDMMAEFNAIDSYPFDRDARRLTLEAFLDHDSLGRCWVIRHGDAIVGYLVLAFGFSFEYNGRDAFIDELFMKEEFRNRGAGRQVMKFVEKQAGELAVKAIHLEVEKHNEKGNRLYTGQGYKGNNRRLLTKKIKK